MPATTDDMPALCVGTSEDAYHRSEQMGWLWKWDKKLCFGKLRMRMESIICFKRCYTAMRVEVACSYKAYQLKLTLSSKGIDLSGVINSG